jgi:hypothetical protein
MVVCDGMNRQKATITLDRAKAAAAVSLLGAKSVSMAVDIALDRLIRVEQLRRDISAYGHQPQTEDELALAEMDVEFDLNDDDVDYGALYGVEP